MSNTQAVPFAFDDALVRALWVEGDPWFVLADVCRVLEITNNRNVTARLDDDEKGVHSMDTLGGPQEMTIISESGLYALVLTSRKPQAKRFRKWITAEVIPSLRKTGRYEMPGAGAGDRVQWNANCMDRNEMTAMVSMVRECRGIWGKAAARRLWQSLPLPQPVLGDPAAKPTADNSPAAQWWAGRLRDGEQIPGLGEWRELVASDALLNAFFDAAGEAYYTTRAGSDPIFGKYLSAMIPGLRRRRAPGPNGRYWAYVFPPLEECRKAGPYLNR